MRESRSLSRHISSPSSRADPETSDRYVDRRGRRRSPGVSPSRRLPSARGDRQTKRQQPRRRDRATDRLKDFSPARARAIRTRLLAWYQAGGKRSFSWRRTKAPYLLLLAEVLLQRTRADQVESAYSALRTLAPSPAHLARANHRQILRCVRHLGLPARVRIIRKLAQALVRDFGGAIPETRQLLGLPGVGTYTAEAVGVFARGERRVLLDWTTARLLVRVTGRVRIHRPNSDLAMKRVAQLLLGRADPRAFNWALIDLAATTCTPRPRCPQCPLRSVCWTGSRLDIRAK